jgi:release factor glutamine methyltransferase
MGIKLYFEIAKQKLSSIYPETEAQQISFLLINHLTGFTKTDIILDKPLMNFDESRFQNYLEKLLNFEPIQYVTGSTEFYGLNFNVNQNTLIPRPETEELVEIIIKENKGKKNLKILDIGTGTGCIALSIANQLTDCQYYAIDISKEAIKVATQNAAELNLKVTFIEANILEWDTNKTPFPIFDIIVSNPPYVLKSDKGIMSDNVLKYEPELALFVPDEHPLKFYIAMVAFSQQFLQKNGRLYFEIHEQMGAEMLTLMKKNHFYDAEIRNDFNNKARFALGTFTP